MKAAAVIEQYKNGRRDFRGESLRGGNLRGADLAGADFSGCDIRGANFSRANLTGVKFAGAKAGLPKRWLLFLLEFALALIVIASFLSVLAAYLVVLIFDSSSTENQVAGWSILIFLICLCAVTWRKNILAGAVAVAVAVALAGAVAVAVAIALTLFFCWLGWLTLKQEHRDPWLRKIVIAFAAIGGTSFFQANLTATDFTGATLKSTNFNQAILNKTIFKQAIKLELARPGNTLLANPQVREFLIDSRTGSGKDFAQANLRGAYLERANLQTANLRLANISEASLQYANLAGANLSEVNAVNTDLRHATLTGACVENWNIDATTQLDEVDCQYIYLLNGQKERRPSSGEFQPGEFTKLFAEMFDTVDLIFRNGVDWKAFIAALKEVQVQNEDTPLQMQSIANKGDGVIVVKVDVPPDTDKLFAI